MKKPIALIFAAAASLPFATSAPALAQTTQGGEIQLSPQVQAQMQQIRANAKTAAFNSLSADHRTRVQAVIAEVNNNTIDRQTGAQQIDAILSPSETQAVLAEQLKMRDAMRAIRNSPPRGNGTQHRTPDAGRALIMLGSNREGRPHGTP